MAEGLGSTSSSQDTQEFYTRCARYSGVAGTQSSQYAAAVASSDDTYYQAHCAPNYAAMIPGQVSPTEGGSQVKNYRAAEYFHEGVASTSARSPQYQNQTSPSSSTLLPSSIDGVASPSESARNAFVAAQVQAASQRALWAQRQGLSPVNRTAAIPIASGSAVCQICGGSGKDIAGFPCYDCLRSAQQRSRSPTVTPSSNRIGLTLLPTRAEASAQLTTPLLAASVPAPPRAPDGSEPAVVAVSSTPVDGATRSAADGARSTRSQSDHAADSACETGRHRLRKRITVANAKAGAEKIRHSLAWFVFLCLGTSLLSMALLLGTMGKKTAMQACLACASSGLVVILTLLCASCRAMRDVRLAVEEKVRALSQDGAGDVAAVACT